MLATWTPGMCVSQQSPEQPHRPWSSRQPHQAQWKSLREAVLGRAMQPDQASTCRGPPAEQAVQEVEMLSKLQREAEAGMRSLRKGPKAESRAAGALEQSMAAQRPLTQRQATAARSALQQPRILAGQALPDSFLYTRDDLSLQEGRGELIEFANTIFIRSLCNCLKLSQERCLSMLNALTAAAYLDTW